MGSDCEENHGSGEVKDDDPIQKLRHLPSSPKKLDYSSKETSSGCRCTVVSPTETSYDPNDDQIETITSRLNFDCLIEILSHLDASGQVAAAQVCRRWRWACQEVLKRVKIIDLTSGRYSELMSSKCKGLRQFLTLCCNVTEIFVIIEQGEEIIPAIADTCPQLDSIAIEHQCQLECWVKNPFNLTKEFPRLKYLSFYVSTSWQCNLDAVWKLINLAPQLEEISVEGDIRGRGRWLKNLSKPLKSLHLWMDFDARHLLVFLEKYGDKLIHLSLNPLHSLSILNLEKLNSIFSLTPNLTELSLVGFHFYVNQTARSDSKIVLKQLKLLHLHCSTEINQYLLSQMDDGCPNLTRFIFSHIGHAAWPKVAPPQTKLDGLTSRALSRAPIFNEDTFQSMSQCLWSRVKELALCCSDLCDDDCAIILRNAVALENLDVSYNLELTNDTFDYACDVIRKDRSRPKLTVKLFGCYYISRWASDVDPALADRITIVID